MLDLAQIESFYPEHLRPFKRNLLREYLQYKILETITNSAFAGKLCFMGGTAIHIVHAIPRFSEDIDFDNIGVEKKDFEQLANGIKKRLTLEGYSVEITTSYKNAYIASIKIANILFENSLSSHKGEKMLIQLDTEPQAFDYKMDSIIINKFDVFSSINVVPIDILLAQKIFAIFMRKRPMGRDFYDAIFLFGKTKPNYAYLQLKLGIKNTADLKQRLDEKCKKLDFTHLAKDTEQFLFNPSDARKILLFNDYVNSAA